MSDFKPAYHGFVKPAEGYYSDHPNDKGKETYMGIARKFYPNWEGWIAVDFYKQNTNPNPPNNTKIPGLDGMVEEFFKINFWDKYRLGEINNQWIANIVFDWIVNSGTTGAKQVQKIVGVAQDGIFGPITLGAINAQEPNALYATIWKARDAFYDYLVDKDPTQAVFKNGWKARLAMFPTTISTGAAGLLMLAGFFFWG